MAKRISIAGLALLLIAVALFAAGDYAIKRRAEQETCGICLRHIRPEAGVIAEVGGNRRHVCCAHCAITEALQEHKPLRLVEVTDYDSRRKLDPSQAWYVDGSRIVACEHEDHMGEMKQMQHPTFDRCSPGTFAFATRAAADAFAQANGGVVRNMDGLLAAINAEVQP